MSLLASIIAQSRRRFTPLSLSPALWLDASDSTTLFNATTGGSLPADGAAIARWEDKSGNGRHATQSTGISQPLRKTAIQNGRDVVRFDGSNDFLAVPDFHQNNVSVFAVYQPANNGNQQHVLRKGLQTGVSLEYGMRATNATTATFVGATSSSAAVSSATKTVGGNWILHRGIYDGSNVRCAVNAQTEVLVAQTGNLFNGATTLRIGASYSSDSDAAAVVSPLQGDIAEMLIFPTALSDINRAAVEAYLNARWVIY